MVGREFAPYKILEKLGQGGMGEVYLAEDTSLNRRVALKFLPASLEQNEENRNRLIREAQAAAAIDHPYICAIHGVGRTPEGQDYISMEFVEGETLEQRLSGGRLSRDEALRLAREIGEALESAHGKGFIHRDLKPSNVMVTAQGHVKVMDFGLAKRIFADPSEPTVTLTAAGAVVGTLAYMSPEQIKGKAADQRSDIFSFGVILCEMLTGVHPFRRNNTFETVSAILNDPPGSIQDSSQELPEVLEHTVVKMLEKEPARRYQSVHEVLADLGWLIAKQPIRPRSFRLLQRVPHKAHRLLIWLIVLPVIAGAGWFVLEEFFGASSTALGFEAREWVLITDFKNETQNPLFDRALLTALTASLQQSPHVNVVSHVRAEDTLRRMGKQPAERIDERLGQEICLRDGVRGLISGEISQLGNQFVVTAKLIDPRNGLTVRSYSERAQGEDRILDALDELAAAVRRDLGESILSLISASKPLPMMTTPSIHALKLYADANWLWEKGRYDDAVQMYQDALDNDADFAMAHVALGIAYCSFIYNDFVKGRKHLERALELSDRTTPAERMLLEAQYHGALQHTERAIELYRVYLEEFPDHWGPRFNLARTLMMNGREEEAIDQFKEVLRVFPTNAAALINIATACAKLGQYSDALHYYESAFELEPTWLTQGNLNHEYGFSLVAAGHASRAREIFQLAVDDPRLKAKGYRSLALLDHLEGRYREARKLLEEATLLETSLQLGVSVARDRLLLSLLLESLGDSGSALEELDQAVEALKTSPPQVWLLTGIGTQYARHSRLEQSSRLLEVVSEQVDPENSAQMSNLHQLQGEIELARGNFDGGVELLRRANREKNDPLTVYALARAFALGGKPEEAVPLYEQLLQTPESLGWEAQFAWVDGHYLLAELYAQLGRRAEAAQVLERLQGWWSNEDSDLPPALHVRSLAAQLKAFPEPGVAEGAGEVQAE